MIHRFLSGVKKTKGGRRRKVDGQLAPEMAVVENEGYRAGKRRKKWNA